MATLPESVDVAIVGAGTAGAAAAAACAQRGLSVLCVDRAPLGEAGARWVNGVAADRLERAGIPAPDGDELVGGREPFHMLAGWGPSRVVVDGHNVLEVDMRHLVARLQARAQGLGAELIGETQVRGAEGAMLRTDRGAVRARWIVDASGLKGSVGARERIPAAHICVAAQEVRECTDEAEARAYFDRHEVPFGETLCFSGIAGGYSVLNVHSDGRTVSILTGSIPADGHASGPQILARFVQEQSWIGDRVFGGSRAIPLRRPRERLARGNSALVGDAGCQVFPAHGSGIGPGLIAARVLAEELAAGRGVRGYAVRWQREHGGLLAGYDLFRRFSQTLSVEELEQLMGSGLFDPALMRGGLEQRLATPTPSMLPGLARGLTRAPGLGARMAAVIAKMVAVRALYANYPKAPEAVPLWSRQVARLFSERQDAGSAGS